MLRGVLWLALLAPQAVEMAGLPPVEELVAKNLASRGGIERLQAVKSMRLTGRLTVAPGREAPVTIEMKRPNKVRLEFQFLGKTGVQAFDGETAWRVLPFRGIPAPEKLPEAETAAVRQESDFDGPLVGWRQKGLDVKVVAQETYQDALAWRLRITFPDQSRKDVWLDALQCLERKSESSRRVRGETQLGESLLLDYREVEGLRMPHAFENGKTGASERQRLTITQVELNSELDDARFAMPQAPAME